MDVNEHKRLPNITIWQKLKSESNSFIVFLQYTFTIVKCSFKNNRVYILFLNCMFSEHVQLHAMPGSILMVFRWMEKSLWSAQLLKYGLMESLFLHVSVSLPIIITLNTMSL